MPLDYTATDAKKELQTPKRSAGTIIAVSNSTPLIALAKIDRLGLFKDYFGEIFHSLKRSMTKW